MIEFFQAFGMQSRVVHAFILRETRTRFGKTRLGYLWALVEPMAYILTMVVIFSALGRGAPIDVDITLFFFSGVVPFLMFSKMMTGLSAAIDANQQLLTYPQVKTLDIMVARLILEFATLFLVAVIYLAVTYLLGTFSSMERMAAVIGGLMMAALLGSGMGLLGGIAKLYMPAYSNLQGVLSRMLFFTSGIFFVADSLPQVIQDWLWYNPVLHLTEWVRSAFFHNFESRFYDLSYPGVCILFLLFMGLSAERVSRHKLRV